MFIISNRPDEIPEQVMELNQAIASILESKIEWGKAGGSVMRVSHAYFFARYSRHFFAIQ